MGAGDAYGQAVSHGVASGMGGLRAAGDLVARLEITRGMRLAEAKAYVAERVGVSVADLSDPVAMLDVRKALRLGAISEAGEVAGIADAQSIEAKFNIAELLGLPICSVTRFRAMVGAPAGARTRGVPV